jgi:hypothetical protein
MEVSQAVGNITDSIDIVCKLEVLMMGIRQDMEKIRSAAKLFLTLSLARH